MQPEVFFECSAGVPEEGVHWPTHASAGLTVGHARVQGRWPDEAHVRELGDPDRIGGLKWQPAL